jgi:apolipoprotein D and lipocalin family protein
MSLDLLSVFKGFKQTVKPLFMTLGVVTLFNLSGCTQVPKGVEPVQNFDLERYLGQWHEIARLDHSFERGLTDVTATYSKREDGGVRVMNSGFNTETQAIKSAEGKAYFIGSPNVGSLKVSFFGPFYGGYHIAKLDEDYQMALVIGPNTDYGWILARDKQPGLVACEDYLKAAEQLGIARADWIMDTPCQ